MKYFLLFVVFAAAAFGGVWAYNNFSDDSLATPGAPAPGTPPTAPTTPTTPPGGGTQIAATGCYNYGTKLDAPVKCPYNTPSCTSAGGCVTQCGSCSYNICEAPSGGPLKKWFPTPCDTTPSPFFGHIKSDSEFQSCLASTFGQPAVDDWVLGKIVVWPADALTPKDNLITKDFTTCYDGYYKRFCAKLSPQVRTSTYKSLCDKY